MPPSHSNLRQDRWRWLRRVSLVGMGIVTALIFTLFVRSFWIADRLWHQRSWTSPASTSHAFFDHSMSLWVMSDTGVFVFERIYNEPFLWEVEPDVTTIPANETTWERRSVPTTGERSRSGDGPARFYESPSEWRHPLGACYSWAHAAYHVRVIEVHGVFILLACFAIASPVAWRSYAWRRRARRRRTGDCMKCGYVKQSIAVCPECGFQEMPSL